MIEFLIENKEIITVILGIAIGFIPTVFEIKKKKKKKFNKTGFFFIFLILILIGFSIFTAVYENGKLTQNKISISFSLRSKKSNMTVDEVAKLLPNEIQILSIKFGEAQTSGTFKLEKIYDGKGHSFSSKFAKYKCDNLLVTDIENFPKRIHDIQNTDVTITFSIDKFSKDFLINQQPTLKIKEKEYYGEIDTNLIYFKIK